MEILLLEKEERLPLGTDILLRKPAGCAVRKNFFFEMITKVYNEAKARGEKYCGIYAFWTPQFVPIDINLVKSIMQTDFVHFVNHGLYMDEENDPLTAHLFNLENEKWRNLRAKLTPTFTSGKMKMMFQTMVDCTESLEEIIKESIIMNDPVDIKDIVARFTTDIIGSVAFGVEINSLKNPNSEFRKYGNKIFESSLRTKIIFTMTNLFPYSIMKAIGLKTFEHDMESFFLNLTKNTVEYREKNNVYRKDFLHLLIQLKNLNKVTDDDKGICIQTEGSNAPNLSEKEMAAQTFVFFAAGFETSSTVMSFALLELAQKQDVQDKVREEIVRVLNKHGNKITYDAIMEMDILERVVLETLRMHPPVPVLPRVCNKDYKIPGSDLVIKAGTQLQIPTYTIHRDPEYYPNPDEFDPDRFTEENKATRPICSYMPFGEGPRTCIGLRFGKLQAKVGLCAILKNSQVLINEKTKFPLSYKLGGTYNSKENIYLDFKSVV